MFTVHEIRPAQKLSVEDMGSKDKFWILDETGQEEWLFKIARENTGEHWAEKIACELAALLGVPHAQVELAVYAGKSGCISRNLKRERQDVSIVHGNEILEVRVDGYEKTKRWKQSKHTYTNIIEAIEDTCKRNCDDLRQRFAGYLFLDAWIGNMDRHHENWALMQTEGQSGPAYDLCPSYDHGSSLGRELRPAAMRGFLEEDRIQEYISPTSKKRGRGAIYWFPDDERPLRPIDLVNKIHQDAVAPWRKRLAEISMEEVTVILEKVPESCMIPLEKEFVATFLATTQRTLCEL